MELSRVLSSIPAGLRNPLVKEYNNIVKNFLEGRWGSSELSGGKFCEVAYTILRGYVDSKYPDKPSKPKNMIDACLALEKETSFPRSIRIQIPRMLIALYEIRNNRGVGHVGGDVDPNHMDATAVLYMSKWVMAELIRLFHGVDTATATNAVETIVERIIPDIWRVDGKYRVLDTTLKMKDKVLLLLHFQIKPPLETDLIQWVEHSNPAVFRRDILKKAHKEKLIEYNPQNHTVQISPKGVQYVESKLIKPLHITK